MITVAVIDDEFLARKRILDLIQYDARFEVNCIIENPLKEAHILTQNNPDILFLDIQMAGITGFELLSKTLSKLKKQPIIIFITAYDNYATDAFDVNALDYLRKPFSDERFQTALDRAINQIALVKGSAIEVNDDIKIPEELLVVKQHGFSKKINPDEIIFIEALGNYVTINLAKTKYYQRNTMKKIEQWFIYPTFIRISRSLIIRVDKIVNHKYMGRGIYYFNMINGKKLKSSSYYKQNAQSVAALIS